MIHEGDALEVLKTVPAESVDCIITSPPYYGLRDYGTAGQIGLEGSPEAFVQALVSIFREARRVLKEDGTLWLNLGDSYSGSGKGRNADGTWNPGKGGSKQETNIGAVKGNTINNPPRDRQTANGHRGVTAKAITGLKQKDLIGIPWRVALALQADGWYLRQDIIWAKPNPMPESVTDRCTKSHEYVFLLTKSAKYYFDANAIKEPAIYGGNEERYERAMKGHKSEPDELKNGIRPRDKRAGKGRIAYGGKRNGDAGTGQESFVSISEYRNKRSVWTVTTKPYTGVHFATFPEALVEPMVLAGCPRGGVVMDPFFGSGTTGVVALKLGRKYVGIELNPDYIAIAEKRLSNVSLPML